MDKKDDEILLNDIDEILDEEIQNILQKKDDEVKNVRDILILSGGSMKGISQLGALYCLKTHNKLNDIKTIAASSIGAIVAVLLCSGHQPKELFKCITMIDVEQMKKLDPRNMITHYGLDDGRRVMIYVRKMMAAKKIDPDIVFKDFYKKTKKHLIITGACVNDKEVYYFSHVTYPNMKVVDAVRISFSVPILFTPLSFENKLFIDGGCIDNFPIQLFADKLDRVIGIYVTSNKKVIDNIEHIEDYLINTLQCLLEGVSHRHTCQNLKQVIKIVCDVGDIRLPTADDAIHTQTSDKKDPISNKKSSASNKKSSASNKKSSASNKKSSAPSSTISKSPQIGHVGKISVESMVAMFDEGYAAALLKINAGDFD